MKSNSFPCPSFIHGLLFHAYLSLASHPTKFLVCRLQACDLSPETCGVRFCIGNASTKICDLCGIERAAERGVQTLRLHPL